MNITEAKVATNRSAITTNLDSTYIFKSQAMTDYQIKKDTEKRSIHEQIKRVTSAINPI